MLGYNPPQPKLWKALLVAAIFVFPASYGLHHFARAVPSPVWYSITAVLWVAFGYNMHERMLSSYNAGSTAGVHEDELGE